MATFTEAQATQIFERMKPTWQEAILKSFEQFPQGRASNDDMYRTVGNFKPLTASHKHPQWGSRPPFHDQVRSEMSHLCARGDLVALADAQHQITPQGRKRISI